MSSLSCDDGLRIDSRAWTLFGAPCCLVWHPLSSFRLSRPVLLRLVPRRTPSRSALRPDEPAPPAPEELHCADFKMDSPVWQRSLGEDRTCDRVAPLGASQANLLLSVPDFQMALTTLCRPFENLLEPQREFLQP